jgi:hypothetical protein
MVDGSRRYATTRELLRWSTTVVLGITAIVLLFAGLLSLQSRWLLRDKSKTFVGMTVTEALARRRPPDGVASADDPPTWKRGFLSCARPVEGRVYHWVIEDPSRITAYKVYVYADDSGLVTCVFVGGT